MGKGNSQTKINQFAKSAQKEEGNRTPISKRLKKHTRGNQDKDKRKSPQGNSFKTDKAGDVLGGETDEELKRGLKVDGKSFGKVIPTADQFAETLRKKDNQKTDEEQKKGLGIDGKGLGRLFLVQMMNKSKISKKRTKVTALQFPKG